MKQWMNSISNSYVYLNISIIATIPNSTTVSDPKSSRIATNLVNPLFHVKFGIVVIFMCEERKNIYFSYFHQYNFNLTKLMLLLASPRCDNLFETPPVFFLV